MNLTFEEMMTGLKGLGIGFDTIVEVARKGKEEKNNEQEEN